MFLEKVSSSRLTPISGLFKLYYSTAWKHLLLADMYKIKGAFWLPAAARRNKSVIKVSHLLSGSERTLKHWYGTKIKNPAFMPYKMPHKMLQTTVYLARNLLEIRGHLWQGELKIIFIVCYWFYSKRGFKTRITPILSKKCNRWAPQRN